MHPRSNMSSVLAAAAAAQQLFQRAAGSDSDDDDFVDSQGNDWWRSRETAAIARAGAPTVSHAKDMFANVTTTAEVLVVAASSVGSNKRRRQENNQGRDDHKMPRAVVATRTTTAPPATVVEPATVIDTSGLDHLAEISMNYYQRYNVNMGLFDSEERQDLVPKHGSPPPPPPHDIAVPTRLCQLDSIRLLDRDHSSHETSQSSLVPWIELPPRHLLDLLAAGSHRARVNPNRPPYRASTVLPVPVRNVEQASSLSQFDTLATNHDASLSRQSLVSTTATKMTRPFWSGGPTVGATANHDAIMKQVQHPVPTAAKLMPLASKARTEGTVGACANALSTATNSHVTSKPALLLSHPTDAAVLSEHQAFVRQHVQFFVATKRDVNSYTPGRRTKNGRYRVNQVGIQCRHCAHLWPVTQRGMGSSYIPNHTLGIYQAAQNLSAMHLQCGTCPCMPNDVKQRFVELLPTKNVASKVGRKYWSDCAIEMGLVNTEHGIFFVQTKSDAASSAIPR